MYYDCSTLGSLWLTQGCSLCSRGAEFWPGAQRQSALRQAALPTPSGVSRRQSIYLNRGVSIFKMIKSKQGADYDYNQILVTGGTLQWILERMKILHSLSFSAVTPQRKNRHWKQNSNVWLATVRVCDMAIWNDGGHGYQPCEGRQLTGL